MGDLVTRLRTWVHAVDAVSASDLMDEAANLIELLEALNAASHSGFMVLASAVDGMSGEVARLRLLSANGDCPEQDNAANRDILSAEEREAIEYFARDNWAMSPVLRGLLERL